MSASRIISSATNNLIFAILSALFCIVLLMAATKTLIKIQNKFQSSKIN